MNKLRVHCPLIDLVNDEVKQIFKPGIENSDKCELVSEQDVPWRGGPYTLWLRNGGDPTNIPADVLLIHGSYGKKENFQEFYDRHPQLPVVMVDYKDHADCFYGQHDIVTQEPIQYFKRSMVNTTDRSIYTYDNYIHVGHAPYCVREDLYSHMNTLDVERDIDVSCFFNPGKKIDMNNTIKHVRSKTQTRGHARGFIADVVDQMNIEHKHVGTTASVCQNTGRQGIDIDKQGSMQNVYADMLMRSKIVVTACPSNYEGDYRLFEAMSSGALVIHNRMVQPPHGLVEDEHWVLYDDSQQLKQKIEHFVNNPEHAQEIAQNGQQFCLQHHRPHHRIEQFLKKYDHITQT